MSASMSASRILVGSFWYSYEHHDNSLQGRSHAENQDHHGYALIGSGRGGEYTAVLFAVADGATGRPAGERASELAIETVRNACRSATLDVRAGGGPQAAERVIGKFLRETIMEAQVALTREAEDPAKRGLSTTLSLALVAGNQFVVACVGDSPVFHWNGKDIARLPRGGKPGDPGAMLGPDHGEPLPTITAGRLEQGQQLLLATDGLTEVVDDDVLRHVFGLNDVHKAVDQLITAAKNREAKDDVTAFLVRQSGREAFSAPAQRGPAPTPPKREPPPERVESRNPRHAGHESTRRPWLDPWNLGIALAVLGLVALLVFALLKVLEWQHAPAPAADAVSQILAGKSGEMFAIAANADVWVVAEKGALRADTLQPMTQPWISLQRPDRQLAVVLRYEPQEATYHTEDRRHVFRVYFDVPAHALLVDEPNAQP